MMLVPPMEQFLTHFTVNAVSRGFMGAAVYLIIPNSIVGTLIMNGVAVTSSNYSAIGSSGYS